MTSQDRIGHCVQESKERQSEGEELTQEELVDAFTSFEQNVQRWWVVVFPVVGFDSSVQLGEIVAAATHIIDFQVLAVLLLQERRYLQQITWVPENPRDWVRDWSAFYLGDVVAVETFDSVGWKGHGQDFEGNVGYVQVEVFVLKSVSLSTYYLSQPIHSWNNYNYVNYNTFW